MVVVNSQWLVGGKLSTTLGYDFSCDNPQTSIWHFPMHYDSNSAIGDVSEKNSKNNIE
jgi:hypothetical protein